jgi:hypothetical protein
MFVCVDVLAAKTKNNLRLLIHAWGTSAACMLAILLAQRHIAIETGGWRVLCGTFVMTCALASVAACWWSQRKDIRLAALYIIGVVGGAVTLCFACADYLNITKFDMRGVGLTATESVGGPIFETDARGEVVGTTIGFGGYSLINNSSYYLMYLKVPEKSAGSSCVFAQLRITCISARSPRIPDSTDPLILCSLTKAQSRWIDEHGVPIGLTEELVRQTLDGRAAPLAGPSFSGSRALIVDASLWIPPE